MADVVAIHSREDCTWLGELTREDQYEAWLAWAVAAPLTTSDATGR